MPHCRPPRFPDLWENDIDVIREIDWRPFLKTNTLTSINFTVEPSNALLIEDEIEVVEGIAQCRVTPLQAPCEVVIFCKAVLSTLETFEVEVLQLIREGASTY